MKDDKGTSSLYILVILTRSAVRKYHRLGGSYTAGIYFSQFQRLEVLDQGAGRVKR